MVWCPHIVSDRDSLEETDDGQVQALPYPALRINGQLAEWTSDKVPTLFFLILCSET